MTPNFKPRKPCNANGCPKIVPSGTSYCEEHQKKYDEQIKERDKQYDKERGTATQRGYDVVWGRARLSYLASNPLCERCEINNIIKPAVVVHHIKPLNEGGERLNPDNFMSLCKDCHKEAHKGERWKKK